MNNLILISGNLGSTHLAGRMLASYLDGENTLMITRDNPSVNFADYDRIIFGTNVRMFRLNRSFKKYVKLFNKSKSKAPVYCYIIAADDNKSGNYIAAAKSLLPYSVAVYAGGFLDEQAAKGFDLKVVKSVKDSFIKEGRPLPRIRTDVIRNLAELINVR